MVRRRKPSWRPQLEATVGWTSRSILIPAENLVNGASIPRTEPRVRVEYFHIELEMHDVILAESAESETFVDDDSRMMFHNAGTFAELYPESERTSAFYCAPRLTRGYEVQAIRGRLAGRAQSRAASRAERTSGRQGSQAQSSKIGNQADRRRIDKSTRERAPEYRDRDDTR